MLCAQSRVAGGFWVHPRCDSDKLARLPGSRAACCCSLCTATAKCVMSVSGRNTCRAMHMAHLQTGCCMAEGKKWSRHNVVNRPTAPVRSRRHRRVGEVREQRLRTRHIVHSRYANSEMSKRMPTRSTQARRAWRASSGRRSVSTGSTASRKTWSNGDVALPTDACASTETAGPRAIGRFGDRRRWIGVAWRRRRMF